MFNQFKSLAAARSLNGMTTMNEWMRRLHRRLTGGRQARLLGGVPAWVLAGALIGVQMLEGHAAAAPVQAPASGWDARAQAYLTANTPARLVRLAAGAPHLTLAFVASAGEAMTLQVRSARAASACDASLQVVDAAGRLIARMDCASAAGQALEVVAPAASVYRARLAARKGAAATLTVALSSPARAVRQAQADPACASQPLPLDVAVGGTWEGSCSSVSFAGHFARYYTVSVPKAQVISIYLKSAIDPVLVLHDGDSAQGTLLATAQTGSGAGTDAEIVMALPAGTYTVEATSRLPGVTGTFTLAARRNTAPCFGNVKPGATVSDQWTTDCAAEFRDNHYAKFYTLKVPSRQVLSLVVRTSQASTPSIQLRNGPTQLGAVIATTQTAYPHVAGFNQLVEPGIYTIEVGGFYPLTLDSFTLSISRASRCVQETALDVEVQGELTPDCSATFVQGRFAKYYTFTVPTNQMVTVFYSAEAGSYAPNLVMRQGAGMFGPRISFADPNFGDAAVVQRAFLKPGAYTLEATSEEGEITGSFTLAVRTNSAPCFGALPVNAVLRESWEDICPGSAFGSRYAKYKTLTVRKAARYTFNLSGSVAPVLVLRGGLLQTGPILQRAVGGGSNGPARISTLLQPGDYLLEATTYNPLVLGDFELNTQADQSTCNETLQLNSESSGTWTQDCPSSTFGDRYARFYTVEVATPQIVTAMLTSPKDGFLVLHDGTDPNGVLLAEDDNAGIGLNASIARLLMPGKYTYEATTSEPGRLGEFGLAVRTNTAPCFSTMALGQTVTGNWLESCISTTMDERYARFYVFSVTESRPVTLQLTSATDAYLVLRGGPAAQLGTVVARDDNSGGGTDARIAMTLPAGNYTVEVTTGQPRQLGAYSLRVD